VTGSLQRFWQRARHPVRHRWFTLGLCAAVLLSVSGWFAWENYLEDLFFPRRWGVVEEGRIYRSGLIHKSLVKSTLVRHNIGVVVSLINEECWREDQNAERQAVAELGIERIVLPLGGNGTGNIHRYAEAIAAIVRAKKQGKAVLVHCTAGTSRTGGVICMYRILVQGTPPAQALAEMRRYKFNPKKNPELIKFLNDNMGTLARMLVEMGVIERVPDPLPRIGA